MKQDVVNKIINICREMNIEDSFLDKDLLAIVRSLRAQRNFSVLFKIYDALFTQEDQEILGVSLLVEYSYFLETIKDFNNMNKVLDQILIMRNYNVNLRIVERFLDCSLKIKRKISYDKIIGLSAILKESEILTFRYIALIDKETVPNISVLLNNINQAKSIIDVLFESRIIIKTYPDKVRELYNLLLKINTNLNSKSIFNLINFLDNNYISTIKVLENDKYEWQGSQLIISHDIVKDATLIIIGKNNILFTELYFAYGSIVAPVYTIDFSFLEFDEISNIFVYSKSVRCDVSKNILKVVSIASLLAENKVAVHYIVGNVTAYEIKNAIVSKFGVIIIDNKYIISESCESRWNDPNLGILFSQNKKEALLKNEESEKEKISQLINGLVISRNNYYHFNIDFVSKFLFMPNSFRKNILSLEALTSWQKDILNLLDLSIEFYIPNKNYLEVENLIFIVKSNGVIKQMSNFIKEKLQSRFDQDKKPLRIYIDRRQAKNRKLINESELIDCLNTKGFEIVTPENLSLEQQIRIFRESEIIISASGAALTNLLYCNPSVKVLEIVPPAGDVNFWTRFALELGIEITKIESRYAVKSSSDLNSLFEIDLNAFNIV